MADVAELGLKVDSGPVTSVTAALKNFAPAAVAAAPAGFTPWNG